MVPYYLSRVNYSRGKRHGEARWQKDIGKQWTAEEEQERTNTASIVLRWQNDEKYRESQKVHGWTEDSCRYLGYHKTIDISYSATWHQRNRYENTILLVFNDDDRQAGSMRARKDLKSTTQTFDENKDDRTPTFRSTRGHGKDHSTKHCEQTWNGTAQIGKLNGRKLPLHHPQACVVDGGRWLERTAASRECDVASA